jgi:hypothetical protein
MNIQMLFYEYSNALLRISNSMSDCHWVRRNELDFMGYSLRTNKYRYIQWMVWDGAALHPKWDEVVGVELYDHTDHDQVS